MIVFCIFHLDAYLLTSLSVLHSKPVINALASESFEAIFWLKSRRRGRFGGFLSSTKRINGADGVTLDVLLASSSSSSVTYTRIELVM